MAEQILVVEKLPIKGTTRKFAVQVGHDLNMIGFEVAVEREYWLKLTNGKRSATLLVQRSFEFLLTKEKKGDIRRQFNLREIQKYFPEYEKVMERRCRRRFFHL